MKRFLLGALCGAVLFGLDGLRIVPHLGTPGVLLSMPFHNSLAHPLWAISCILLANAFFYGLFFVCCGWLVSVLRMDV